MDEPEPSGDSKVSERIIGHGNALEYCLCGFFFCLWLFDNVQEERNLLVFDLATMFPFPFSVPTAVITSDLGPEKYSFIILHSFHIHYRRNLGLIWIIPQLCQKTRQIVAFISPKIPVMIQNSRIITVLV